MLRTRHLLVPTILVLVMPASTGCYKWVPTQPSPEVVESQTGRKLRVQLLDGELFEADSGVVRLDTLIVWRWPTDGSSRYATDVQTGDVFVRTERQSIPFSRIVSITIRKTDLERVAYLLAIPLAIPMVDACRKIGCSPPKS